MNDDAGGIFEPVCVLILLVFVLLFAALNEKHIYQRRKAQQDTLYLQKGGNAEVEAEKSQ